MVGQGLLPGLIVTPRKNCGVRREQTVKRFLTVVSVTIILLGALCVFQVNTGRTGDAPDNSPDPAEVLVALYAAVPPGGSISVVTSSLTEPRVVVELVRARQRGVNVRVIAERRKLAEKRDEIALYNLRHYGVPVKINVRPGAAAFRASIVDGVSVVTGTYDYSVPSTPAGTLTVTARSEGDLLRRHEEAFNAMWTDESSYKLLEPMDAARVVAFTVHHSGRRYH
jgi:hypothetical protein